MTFSVALPKGTAQTSTSLVFLLNVTFCFALGGVAVGLWSLWRSRSNETAARRLSMLYASLPALVLLTLGAIFNIGSAVYLGYIVPRDIMQDIVSAQRFLHGQPAFPMNMTEDIQRTLDQQAPPVSLARWIPALTGIERKAYHDLVTEPWTQAHPAAMTLVLALFGTWLPVRHIFLLSAVGSMAALVATVLIVWKELRIAQSQRVLAASILMVAGWFPTWISLRTGQVSLVLAFLLTLGWYYLRQDRFVAAGLITAVAVTLKLFPGLLLFYFLLRRRKALWPAAIASACLVGFSFLFVGRENTQDYLHVVNFIQEYYKGYPGNLSLLGFLYDLMPSAEQRWHAATILFRVLAVLCVLAAGWAATRRTGSGEEKRALDLEFALFVSLMVLLSPLSWDHYLVILILPLAVLFSSWLQEPARALNPVWGAGILLAAACLAVPQPVAAWLSRMWNSSLALIVLRAPGVGAAGVIALLFLLRLDLSSRENHPIVQTPSTT